MKEYALRLVNTDFATGHPGFNAESAEYDDTALYPEAEYSRTVTVPTGRFYPKLGEYGKDRVDLYYLPDDIKCSRPPGDNF